MGGLLQRAAASLNKSVHLGCFPIITGAIGFVANAISECVGGQILQSIPVLADLNNSGIDLGSITMEVGANSIGALLLVAFGILCNARRWGQHTLQVISKRSLSSDLCVPRTSSIDSADGVAQRQSSMLKPLLSQSQMSSGWRVTTNRSDVDAR